MYNDWLFCFADLKQSDEKWDTRLKIAEATWTGAPTCDVNARLKYATSNGIVVYNGEHQYAIDIVLDFTKQDIEDFWNKTRRLEEAMFYFFSFLRYVAIGVLIRMCKLVWQTFLNLIY